MDPIDQKPTFIQKYKFTLISLFIIVLAAVPLLLLSNTAKQPTKPITQVAVSPTSAPLTTANAEPTLTQVDQNMQTTLNQVDADLQSVSSIDATKDSTSGL